MKKKIVILSAFLTPFRSGAEACAEEVPAQLKNDYDFVIITARMRRDLPREDHLPSGIPVIRVGFGSSFDKWLYPLLAPWEAKKQRPDLLHAILETFAGYALLRCRTIIPGVPRMLTLQTTNRSFKKCEIINAPDYVTAISSVLVKTAKECGVEAELIPNGIPYEAIRRACEKYQKVPGRILFVGRLEYMKGVDVLLNAFARVVDKDAILHIVGSGSQRSILEKQARDLGVAHRVMFRGYLREEYLYKEYAEAEVFCGLSRNEALGNVFLEAQAAGCAIVAPVVGGISDIIQENLVIDGHSLGLLMPDFELVEVAARFDTLFINKHLMQRMAESSIENAKKFDWFLISKKYKSVYNALLSRTT